MKKFLIALAVLLGSVSLANADRVNVGVTVMGGVFEVDGASEIFSGDHSSNTTTTKVTKKASDEDEAEGEFALGSVFVEVNLTDQFGIGVNHVAHDIDSESSENIQNIGGTGVATNRQAQSINTVSVKFSDLNTVYAIAKLNDNVYAKVGYVEVDVQTEENLQTGGAYDDTSLDGYSLAVGYNYGMDNGAFVRVEASYMDLDGVSLTNKNDSTKSVSVDGISGYGAGISIGKSF